MDLEAYLKERGALVDAALEDWLPGAETAPRSLHGAMRHLVFPGGKRLRPGLACAGAEAVGAAPERALPAAMAVELVHTYSLIHDDLPCMDDDAERRGRPTVHVRYGEANAVLAGDGLLASAFECLARAEGYPAPALLAATAELAHAAGSLQLVGGQAEDLAARSQPLGAAEVEAIHRRKTAALLTASVVAGALLGGADEKQRELLRGFGMDLGVAFQIADDLLDRDGDDPCSAVRTLGAEGARQRAAELIDRATARIESFGDPAEALRGLARFAIGRDR